MESRRPAVRKLMAELARARHAAERGSLKEAREAIESALSMDPQNVQALELRQQLDRGSARDTPSRPARTAAPAAAAADPRQAAGWSAFERRVRERRAARCVDAAGAALARGEVSAAREAVAELAMLMPAHAELGRLRELCASASAPAGGTSASIDVRLPRPAVERPADDQQPRASEERPLGELFPITEAAPKAAQPAPGEGRSERARPSRRPREPVVPSWADWPAPGHEPPAAPLVTPAASSEGWRHRSALAAAAAVLVFGVLLPVERSRFEEAQREESAGAGSSQSLETAFGSPEEAPLASAVDEPEGSRLAPDAVDPVPVMTSGDEGTARPEEPAAEEPVMEMASLEPEAPAVRREASAAAPPSEPPPPPARTTPAPQREEPRASGPRASAAAPPAPTPAREPVREPASPSLAEVTPAVDRMPQAMGGSVARVEPPPSLPQPSSPASSGSAPAVAASYVPPARPLPEAVPEEPDGEAAVRDVLQRYVRAYNRLDAVAARAVWPAVDQGALQRAFAQLDSQTLRFERCDIALEDTGGTATCAGQARWVPRVGGRDPKREQRTWRFELERSGDDWVITRAEARR